MTSRAMNALSDTLRASGRVLRDDAMSSLPKQKYDNLFTYGDYRLWPENERWELIGGAAHAMSPAPMTQHQGILGALFAKFYMFLQGKRCRVFVAPFDVRLPEGDEADDDIETVVQPDIVVICDRKKLDRRGCKGAPDLVIEIVSPSTARKDTHEKLTLYERHGVKQYWLVFPGEHVAQVHELRDGKYGAPTMYADNDRIAVSLFPGLEIDLAAVFEEMDFEEHAPER